MTMSRSESEWYQKCEIENSLLLLVQLYSREVINMCPSWAKTDVSGLFLGRC